MTAEMTPPAPTGNAGQPEAAQELSPRGAFAGRPSWVTEERLSQWSGWVVAGDAAEGAHQMAAAPFTLEPTAVVPCSQRGDVESAVQRARSAQRSWATTSYADRARVLLAFHDALLAEQDEVLDLIQWETGKARFHAWQEVGQVVTIARHYARRAQHYLKPAKVRGMVPGATAVKEVRVPKGVVGIISPWNYPLYLGAGDVLPALMAGNAVVSKADSQTPFTLLWARALMARAGLPDDVWQVVTGSGGETGTALVDTVDFVAFTGSTATGREVASRAARRLVAASLELGGKNPLIVRRDADLEAAARGTVTAAFANTGQMCIHVERVYVHQDVYEAFRDELVRATEDLRLGSAYDYGADVGSLTSTAQLEAVREHVQDAVDRGARVLTGGGPRPDLGPLFFAPTLLEGVTPQMRVHAEETFGPVLSLYPVVDDDEAVALANEGTYGLSSSVWSKDVAAAESIAHRLRAGAVNINDGAAAAAGSIEAGMGGMGESGLGRRHGAEGIRKYTDAQTIARQRWLPLGPPKGKPVEGFVHMTNAQLGLMRRLRLR
ncbi:succinic semialdehyde dehydrogenase [Nocardioides jishulii]|uniref:Succinate-semialdehyde dehydrogenase (NADP(+)) n=1 Tax=Nocardioides jishulii TaxID=2575440 RepID=A0A4U2YNE8_9ACTN|nr:succinic semialdehyde dehydrogenase [Nocardioides jishulii]QCX27396.1 succinate-semialdehyde dehydrogenase (NADP(+)) [Nocardioides jishulii]TKI62202.1 succinate-semialdehyde dehydrogenase (NADP(+)) [Nocardioides jishulii]